MKKIILWLVISLGLVSAVNAESVCEKESYCPYIWTTVNYFEKNEKLSANFMKKFNRCYTAEVKRSDKESLCLYMNTTITDYLKTTLTPQEIERFEKYLVEIQSYESYESNKDYYLNALKFLKYFDKMEYWYKKYNTSYHNIHEVIYDFAKDVETLTHPKVAVRVNVKRFVYDKELGNFFEFQNNWEGKALSVMKVMLKDFEKIDSCKNTYSYSMERDCNKAKDLKYIIQWAESKLKEAK